MPKNIQAGSGSTEWLICHPEADAPAQLRPVLRGTIPLGWMLPLSGTKGKNQGRTLLWWRLDLALCASPTTEGRTSSPLYVPGIVLRPLDRFAWDVAGARRCYDQWRAGIVRARNVPEASAMMVPGLDEVLLRPLSGPFRTCEPIPAGNACWGVVRDLLDRLILQLVDLDDPGTTDAAVRRLVRDCPWLPACLPREKRYWDPRRPWVAPDRVDGAALVEDIPRAAARGRPRGATPPDLAMDLARILGHGNALRVGVTEDDERLLGPPKLRFALETACAFRDEHPLPEVIDVRSWLVGKRAEVNRSALLEERATECGRRLQNWTQRVVHGRHETGHAADQVRLITPQLVPDLSVHPRKLAIPDDVWVEWSDRLLLDWLRGNRLVRLLDIVTGHRLDRLRFFPQGATWAQFRASRSERFWRVVERFEPDDLGYRGAVAMIPGAQPGGIIELVFAGFGPSPQDLRTGWLGEQAACGGGPCSSVHEVVESM